MRFQLQIAIPNTPISLDGIQWILFLSPSIVDAGEIKVRPSFLPIHTTEKVNKVLSSIFWRGDSYSFYESIRRPACLTNQNRFIGDVNCVPSYRRYLLQQTVHGSGDGSIFPERENVNHHRINWRYQCWQICIEDWRDVTNAYRYRCEIFPCRQE